MSAYDFDSEYVFRTAPSKDIDAVIQKGLPVAGDGLETLIHTSVAVPDTKVDGFSSVYRNGAFPGGLKRGLTPDLVTYGGFFSRSVKITPKAPCVGYRKYNYISKTLEDQYSFISYEDVNTRKNNLGSGLLYLLQNSQYKKSAAFSSHRLVDSHVSNHGKFDKDNLSFVLTIFAPNRYEWVLTDLMCNDFSITNSSLYDTLGPDASRFIMGLTESPAIVLDRHNIHVILDLKKRHPAELKNLYLMVCMDPLSLVKSGESREEEFKHLEDIEFVRAAAELGVLLVDMDAVEKIGEMFPHKTLPATPETIYTISFTLGTTGSMPKGVVLLQRAIAGAVTFLYSVMKNPASARTFAFLPLAHIFERQCTAYSLSFGGCVGFPQLGGDPLKLFEDLRLFKPHSMANVPRIHTKLEAAIKAATTEHPTSAITRSLYTKVIDTKMDLQSKMDGDPGHHFLYDATVLAKIREKFGYDKMCYTMTGSAPISLQSIKFLKAAFNMGFPQAYGLTESCAAFISSPIHESAPGSCGACGITTEMRLREIPSMGYLVDDKGGPRRELLLRGNQMFAHYYKNEDETSKAIDADGWFATGDIARFDENGRVFIIDRVKNFFKLAQGEYITPEKIENAYLSSNPILTQLYCHGDSLKHFVVGVAGIDIDMVRTFLTDKCKVPATTIQTNQAVLHEINEKENKQFLLENLTAQTCKKVDLKGFEKIHNIYFEIEPLRLDRSVVTPTLKLRRPIAAKFFADAIRKIYEQGSLVTANKI